MGAITSKGRRKKAVSATENHDKKDIIPSLIVTQAGSEPPEEVVDGELDAAVDVDPVGASAKDMTVNEELRRVIEDGRREIKEAQEKLNSSLTTPIVESEAKVKIQYFVTFLTAYTTIKYCFSASVNSECEAVAVRGNVSKCTFLYRRFHSFKPHSFLLLQKAIQTVD